VVDGNSNTLKDLPSFRWLTIYQDASLPVTERFASNPYVLVRPLRQSKFYRPFWRSFLLFFLSILFITKLSIWDHVNIDSIKKAHWENSSNVARVSGSCSSRSVCWMLCFWFVFELFLPHTRWDFFFLPCLFLWRKGSYWSCFFVLGPLSSNKGPPLFIILWDIDSEFDF